MHKVDLKTKWQKWREIAARCSCFSSLLLLRFFFFFFRINSILFIAIHCKNGSESRVSDHPFVIGIFLDACHKLPSANDLSVTQYSVQTSQHAIYSMQFGVFLVMLHMLNSSMGFPFLFEPYIIVHVMW